MIQCLAYSSLITDQRITIDMAIQQLQQLTPYWWVVGEAAGRAESRSERGFSDFKFTFSSLYIHMFILYEDNFCNYQLYYHLHLLSVLAHYKGMQKSHLRR